MKRFLLSKYKFLLLHHFQGFSDSMLVMSNSFSASPQQRNKACHGKNIPPPKLEITSINKHSGPSADGQTA